MRSRSCCKRLVPALIQSTTFLSHPHPKPYLPA